MTSKKLLFINGATANKNRTEYLRKELTKFNIKSHSFNFSGNTNSLKKRYTETKNVIKDLKIKEPLNLCGSSMGAYIAIKLLEDYKVNNLILFCPAVYDIKVFDTLFNQEFTNLIRKKNSWTNTDAFEILKRFQGKVFIVVGKKDEVIPKTLIKLYDQNLVKVKYKEILQISDCPHTIHLWLSHNKEWQMKVTQKIVGLFNI